MSSLNKQKINFISRKKTNITVGMEWNRKFNYPSSTRALVQGKRHYSLDGSNLPSVTTILSATKSEEDKAALAAWKERVGKVEADRIKKEASTRGSSIHKFIEDYLHGKLNHP